ncbi:Clp protease N-terminal domain-containing protein [Pseudonocardia sp. TRM90224]|uniref:Clp protease N-terminal domain-containing protein n=1 Tax=Pseudonocardia sp. TRM90224 TaxID=2812678 RepID=UPI001E3BE071|nr:Clp protease N-terminal domain-containing protein [Pseudonocardia sp. TRM90224]
MFERFTTNARLAVVAAQEQARTRGADAIRTEHLLAGVLDQNDSLVLSVLTAHSIQRVDLLADIDAATAGPSDAEALATLGIDLDEVRRQVDNSFGEGALDRTRATRDRKGRKAFGHLRIDSSAKKALELSLREAIRLKHGQIGAEHILLGLLHAGGAAQEILVGRRLLLDAARVTVAALARDRRAG